MDLIKKKCVACEIGTPPFDKETIDKYRSHIKPEWRVIDNKRIERQFKFKDFQEAMSFVNKVAEIAESEGHHPDIAIFYNKVTLTLWTHASRGLTENDFIIAAKIDALGS